MLLYANMLYTDLSIRFNRFLKEERGAVDLIVIVVLIGVAIGLAAIFSGSMKTLINDLMDTITSSATSTVNDASSTGNA